MTAPYKKFSDVFPPNASDDDEEELVEASPAAQTVAGLMTQHTSTRLSVPHSPNTRIAVPFVIETPARPASAPPTLTTPPKNTAADKKPSLPEFMKNVTMADKDRFVIGREYFNGRGGDGKEYDVVTGYLLDKVDDTGKRKEYDIKKLNFDVLRILLGQMKVGKHWGYSKFKMRRALANAILSADKVKKAGLDPKCNVFRKTNTLLCVINAVFHSERVDHFLHLNDNHKCADHEQKWTFTHFWNLVLDHYKDFEKEDEELTTIQMSDKDPHLCHLAETDGINLKQVDNIADVTIFKKKLWNYSRREHPSNST
jgi:hypothetical protein